MGFIKKHYPAILLMSFLVGVWEVAVKVSKIEPWILPPPSQIIMTLFREREVIIDHTWVTLYEALVGFLFAIVIAFILAMIIDRFPFFSRGFYPILVTSQTIPIISIAPLLFIWFGFGLLPKIVVVILVGFFPIVISTVDGLNSADRDLISLLQTMKASKWQIFTKVKFPSALPSIFSGLKIAATYSVMGAVIGEWLGASKGLGLYMRTTSHSFLTDQVFAAIIVIVLTSILLYGTILALEYLLIPWNRQYKQEESF
ncbi:MAG: ABC transporter permease [Tepidibacillus sp.]|uniref:ABC transporter permease n=1 Tax=Tepidibacillus sp. HK-1 TaxID=1883407 RepID=UPI0008536BE3|nr:ABC transporter permease [Tepidibacillus sp. HK-1]GBF11877.1 putative aliphatic sulfonates transport permease protein SsuC [Tepidibacillus sp. HK-1]